MCLFVATFSIVLGLNFVLSHGEWIDPHAMKIRKSQSILERNALNSCNEFPSVPIHKLECDCSESSMGIAIPYYKRAINLLLASVVRDRSDTFNYKGYLYINIPLEDHDNLVSFARNNVDDVATLPEIDRILSKILVKSSYDSLMESIITWSDHIYFTFYNRSSGVLGACLFILFISYKLLRANITLWVVTKYLIFLAWIIDFTFTWIRLTQESEANQMGDRLKYTNIPPHCNPNQMTTWQYIKYSFSSTDYCREYYQILFKDPFWNIGPFTVFSHQFGSLILIPAGDIGSAIGGFTSGMLGTLPWGLNYFLLPILLIFSAIILCIICTFLTKTSFSINLFHLLHLEFGKNERRAVSNTSPDSNLSALIDVMHHHAIQEIRQDTSNDHTVTSEVSGPRATVGSEVQNSKVLNIELRKDSDNKNQISDSKPTATKRHDGSGDNIEVIGNS